MRVPSTRRTISLSDAFRVLSVLWIEDDGNVEHAVSVVGLRHDRTLKGRLHRIEDLDRLEAELLEAVAPQADNHLRECRC